MRIVKIIIPLFILIVSFVSCKKDKASTPSYTCTTCKTTPDAKAANDASNKGVYKGVIIGSSGTIMFDLQNNGTTITAIMVLDGVTVNLTASVSIVAGQSFVAPFTGTLNGQPVSITFSVGATGSTPTVTTSSIPGHPNSSFTIIKETSTSLVEAFEGTYSTTQPESGNFNMVLSRTLKVFGGTSRKTGTTTNNSFSGIINASNELIDGTGKKIAKLNGDVMTGGDATITINAKRTL
jgi:hypothetical protein